MQGTFRYQYEELQSSHRWVFFHGRRIRQRVGDHDLSANRGDVSKSLFPVAV
jgi:hypothetical protein